MKPDRHNPATRNSQFATHRAFTLIELMISLAMVVILILGINYVFRSATDAVGAGQATNQINSDAQSSQPVLFDDLRNVSKNPPCFIISSQLVTQFLNADDAKNNSDPNVIPIDNAGNYSFIGTSPNQPTYLTPAPTSWISPAFLNSHNHRADILKTFIHGLYHRRSGPDGTYYASDSAQDAFLELGHAALPTDSLLPPSGVNSAFIGPSSLPIGNTGYAYAGDIQNPAVQTPGVPRSGAYAADWVLARRITLLKDFSSIITAGDFYYPDTKGTIPSGINGSAFGVDVTPLSYGTPDTNPADTGINQSQTSRYDLAGVTPEQFDRKIANAILGWQVGTYAGPSLWWQPLVYAIGGISQGTATLPQSYQSVSAPYSIPYINSIPTYTAMPANIDPGQWYNRAQCNPGIQNPVTSASIAEMAPYFLQHCSQFIVEYAGDYIQQDNDPTHVGTPYTYSQMTGIGPDGQIDYYLDANGNKHIRWYGMPRSTTGNTHDDGFGFPTLIRGFDSTKDTLNVATNYKTSGGSGPMTLLLNYYTDVIPLRDYYSLWFASNPPATPGTTGAYAPPWEVDVNFDPTHDYGGIQSAPVATGPNKVAFGTPNNPPRYVAAWHDDMPAMIRILIKVDDTNNKVKDGPWYEYVYRLK